MLTIDNAVSASFPGTKMGVLAMKNVRADSPLAPSAVAQAMDEIRHRYGGLDRISLKELHPVCAYVAYYKKFGYSYHVLAQLESVLQGKKQPRPTLIRRFCTFAKAAENRRPARDAFAFS